MYNITFTYEQAERLVNDMRLKFWSPRSRAIMDTLYYAADDGYGTTVLMHHTMVCVILNFYDHINDLHEENNEEPDELAVEIAELLRKHVASAT
jgi:hypothetical protein